jgi:phosphocarrier protein FPr
VKNRLGLHARPAARFVSTAGQYRADVQIRKNDKTANAKSINQVAMLGVRQGDRIVVSASGDDAEAVLAALRALADDNFGDVDVPDLASPAPKAAPATPGGATQETGVLKGIAASPGVAFGPAALFRPRMPEVVIRQVDDPAQEWLRVQEAVAAAKEEIRTLHKQAMNQVGPGEAAIFEAHRLFLEDPTTLEATRERIRSQQINAEAAWQQEIEALVDAYRAMEDDYMRARAADIEDVGRRVLRNLTGVAPPALDFTEPSILIAADLSPSDTARLDPANVLAICTELGGATAHSAILARALGIPAVVGLGHDVWQITDGRRIAADGDAGLLWTEPDDTLLAELASRRAAGLERRRREKLAGLEPAVTLDDHAVEIAANIGGPNDVGLALEYGAEGVGLFRTEFLFMGRPAAPSEDEQVEAYRRAIGPMGSRPVIIRTLDVGGDKPLPYIELGEEANPFLGWRALRFCLQRPDIFMPQLRAILRASVDVRGSPLNVKIMFPMVSTTAELRQAKAMLQSAREELTRSGITYDEAMEVGIMIEVPSAVAVADQLAREVDFFSIGTNDLTQYVMAADRGNAHVAGLASAFQPAVLRVIRDAAKVAHERGIWIGMCGEMAGNPLATPVLLGIGLDELSMSAPSIPAVKQAIRALTMADARRIADEVLAADSAEAVLSLLKAR